jgi:hypothetical protein
VLSASGVSETTAVAQHSRPKVAVETARASWAVAIKAKTQQQGSGSQQGLQQQQAPQSKQQGSHSQPVRQTTPASGGGMIDLAPPVYRNFVNQPPRSFAPIASEDQYVQYYKQYQDQYATYYSLQSLIKSSIASVQRAYAELEGLPGDSPMRPQKESELRQLLEARSSLTGPWDSAFRTLHAELATLKRHLTAWVQQRALSLSGGTAGGAAGAGQQQQQQQQPSGFGGKGVMLVAASRATPVGA